MSVMLYFGMKFSWLKPGAKLDHLDVYKTKCLYNAISLHSSLILFKHICEKVMEIVLVDYQWSRGILLAYIEVLLLAFL